MTLLTGPAGSGKTHRILQQLREALRRRDAGVRLLTPTATMARHLQSRMAHEGFVFRPQTIQTLSHFVDAFVAGMPQVSEPLLYLIVEEAARRIDRAEFARVVRLPGFCAALARTISEFSSAGCSPERLATALERHATITPLGAGFLAVYRAVERELERRGLTTRSQRLLLAAEAIARGGLNGVHTIWLDGFYALPDPELAVIEAMRGHANLTLTLPTAAITETTRQRLLAMGFTEEPCTWAPEPARVELAAAPSIEREADEIARRILAEAAAGRQFREMGVVLRCPEIYQAVLRATFDRFGIPARFYFDADLDRHAVVRYLAGIVDALLGGWDYEATLAAIRLAPGLDCDEFDFAVRAQMPGAGLAGLQRLAGAETPVSRLLNSFAELSPWREQPLVPADWAARLKDLRRWFAPGSMEPGSHDAATIGRTQATALEQFAEALDEAARALPARPASLAEYWRAAKSVLRLTPLRVDDARRNVVHVLSAPEARQWRLPVVFVCGLVEKQFPKFHTQDPFFPEAARGLLNQAGVRVRTTADFEAEERFLYDWAVTRATESLTLSYPRFDARGQQNLPSQYLDGMAAVTTLPVAPRVPIAPAANGSAAVSSTDLLHAILGKHAAFRPTSLEVYLQCPFQFFARDTLGLRRAPLRPEERLDFRTQGNIVHGVLAEMHRKGTSLAEAFTRVFEQVARRENLTPGYRTEALRERMLADLRALVEDPRWLPGYPIRVEQDFTYTLAPGVQIKGRIDRYDELPGGGALVIDYKYSSAQNTKNRANDGNLLQPQLYMRAVEQCFGRRPDGMSYWGIKGGLEQTEPAPYEPQRAIETTLRVVAEIRAGRMAPHPADLDKCRLCDFRDVCRFVETETAVDAAGAEGESWD